MELENLTTVIYVNKFNSGSLSARMLISRRPDGSLAYRYVSVEDIRRKIKEANIKDEIEKVSPKGDCIETWRLNDVSVDARWDDKLKCYRILAIRPIPTMKFADLEKELKNLIIKVEDVDIVYKHSRVKSSNAHKRSQIIVHGGECSASKIRQFISENGITRLVHFTRLTNLKGIYKQKALLPVSKLPPTIAHPNDSVRLDSRKDCVNLSVQRINKRLFDVYAHRFNRESWCILEINPELMGKNGVMFAVSNAAGSFVRDCGGIQRGIEGLKAMFSDRLTLEGKDGMPIIVGRENIPKNFPTDVQAEVLYPGAISIGDIYGIVVQSEEHYERVKAALEMENVNPLPRIRVCIEDFQ